MIHIKSKREIEKMRAACRLATEVLYATGDKVAAGVTTQQLNDFAHRMTLKNGATPAPLNYKGFPRSICTSINSVVCHGIPSPSAVLKDGDIINIDVTVILDGFHGDTSAMFTVGEISAETKKLIADTESALYIGIEAVQPGGRVSDIGDSIDAFLTPMGYGIVRDLNGHGIGRSFHEEPSIPHFRQKMIRNLFKPGMTFTIEPMVNVGSYEVIFSREDGWTVTTRDNSLSAQFEHTILVTEESYEILTRI